MSRLTAYSTRQYNQGFNDYVPSELLDGIHEGYVIPFFTSTNELKKYFDDNYEVAAILVTGGFND